MRRAVGLNSTHDQKYDDDQQDDAKAAAGVIAPPAAIGPGRQRAQKQYDQYDDQDGVQNASSDRAVSAGGAS